MKKILQVHGTFAVCGARAACHISALYDLWRQECRHSIAPVALLGPVFLIRSVATGRSPLRLRCFYRVGCRAVWSVGIGILARIADRAKTLMAQGMDSVIRGPAAAYIVQTTIIIVRRIFCHLFRPP